MPRPDENLGPFKSRTVTRTASSCSALPKHHRVRGTCPVLRVPRLGPVEHDPDDPAAIGA